MNTLLQKITFLPSRHLTTASHYARQHGFAAATASSQRSMSSNSSNFNDHESSSFSTSAQPHTDDKPYLSVVYVHHVSKLVLQHLQNARAGWLVEQGLDKGLHIKPNGTFVLHFPANEKDDGGKIWTGYDSATRQHWLSATRPDYQGRFLLHQCSGNNNTTIDTIVNKFNNPNTFISPEEEGIRTAVDDMIRVMPPPPTNSMVSSRR